MADVPPPSLSELMRMVAELQQANQRMADENQIMAAQIAELNHVRIEHGNAHQEEDGEHQSQPSHVSETARNEEQQPHDEKEESEDAVGPFTEEVMNFELPKRFTLPLTLTPYDGLGDPKKFIKKFRSIMIVNGASDTVLCRCFPNYLDGPTLDWLCALPAGSISRFHQLAKQFEEHFAGSAIYLHDSDYLNTIKQGPNESLKDYMTRFTKVAISIPDLHPEVHLHAIKSGLRPGKFQETIAVAKPKTLAEFREKAKGQIDIEELRQARKSDKPHFREEEKSSSSKKSFKLTPRFDSYTQFNTKREDIIKEILNSKLIKPPRKAGTYQDTRNIDKSKYCTFHQKHGHNTDDCVVAKDLLEKLARQGHLDKYIGSHIQKRGSSSTANDVPEQHRGKEKTPSGQYERPRGIINCISGGYASGGYSSSARKRSFRAICSVDRPERDVTITNAQPEVTFTHADFNSNVQNLDDPVVISLQLGDLLVKKVLLDPGSSADVLFYSTFQKMKLSDNMLQSTGGDLVGFSGERVPILGSVWLQTTLGEQPLSKSNDIQYLVVDCFSPYNIILGRPFLNKFGAIVSTVHLCVKFPLQDHQIVTIHGDHKEARQCYNISMKWQSRPAQQVNNVGLNSTEHTLAELDPRADFLDRPKPSDDLQKLYFNNDPNKFTYVGNSLDASELQAITTFLQEHADLFAWTPSDMPGIDPYIISHRLATNPSIRPVQQKKRQLGEEKKKASLEETQKLINAEFIKEIRFTTWLANVVMIMMHSSDQNKTAFITDLGNYCYKVMPFGLKNAGATYQRLMDRMFAKQIGRNIEVYVDDMVAKTKVGDNHINDLKEIFGQIRKYNMRLNPEKCAFAVQGGKFLGFLLTRRGIEANPDKCRAVLEMANPKTIKEVQRLTGRLAALSRFVPCLASISIPFFQTIKKKNKFEWNDDCERAFSKLKTTLSQPPVLQKPLQGEDLFLYLSVTDWAVSSALVTERNNVQHPVYFVSKTLQHAELNYPRIEKLARALVFSARRLRPYFQSHVVHVRTNHPLRQVLHKPELAGRLIKWAVELSEFDIRYQSRGPIKSQFLADFIAELTIPSEDDHAKQWILYVDGSSNNGGCGAGIRLEADDGLILEHSIHFGFKASNNQSEYEALLAGIRLCLDLQISAIKVYCDSMLVVQQVNDLFQVKDPLLSKYLSLVKKLTKKFSKFELEHIPREQNQRADILSKLGSTQSELSTLQQFTITSPTVTLTNVLSVSQIADWRNDFIQYLQTGTIPEGIKSNKRFRRQASFFTLLNGTLYRRGYTRPLLKCLNNTEADIALAEAHEGICSTHTGARSLTSKILRAGFFWPTLKQDSQEKIRSCSNCQRHAPLIHIPAEELHQSDISWPFNQWGLDILGPFPTAPGQVRFLIVGIDYFSKWVEAQPLAKITSKQMISFVWKNIICRFGIPQHITTDNGRQFSDQKFQAFLQDLKIKQHFASVEHPQTNGLAETANKVILHALKKKLDDAKGLWAELIPEVLWGYNTTPQTSTKETPFRLVYGSEAMIPLEISQESIRTHTDNHDEARRVELDIIEEIRDISALRQRATQQAIARHYNKSVKRRAFVKGDLVLRKTENARKQPSHGKLAANWDGPYRISEILGNGAYILELIDGHVLPNSWNASSLKKFYS
ncbi:uncharacterized protein [Arachis hypogaea]|uniref:uncharacterized protein n=1 Tax=Arachis hypogaea TaxID=3818 RepID=UPI000DEC3471|nr:uncharacterized protein LOC112705280 [Arachis hypogaea]